MKFREVCASACAGLHEDARKLSLVPAQAAARTRASEQKLLASIYQVPYEHEKVSASLLPALVSAHRVPGSVREWLCGSSRGLLRVVASACAGRYEGRCTRRKNSASRQKTCASHHEDLCKFARLTVQAGAMTFACLRKAPRKSASSAPRFRSLSRFHIALKAATVRPPGHRSRKRERI